MITTVMHTKSHVPCNGDLPLPTLKVAAAAEHSKEPPTPNPVPQPPSLPPNPGLPRHRPSRPCSPLRARATRRTQIVSTVSIDRTVEAEGGIGVSGGYHVMGRQRFTGHSCTRASALKLKHTIRADSRHFHAIQRKKSGQLDRSDPQTNRRGRPEPARGLTEPERSFWQMQRTSLTEPMLQPGLATCT